VRISVPSIARLQASLYAVQIACGLKGLA